MVEEASIVKKPADSNYDIHPILKRRWSPRTFSKIPISDVDIRTLFEAGRWAPSSNNIQPWRIIWGLQGSSAYERILSHLDDFNQKWAKNAPLLLITAFDTKKPDGGENFHALHDVGLFMANLTFQAESMGIAVHQMAGVKFEKAKVEFKLPDHYHVVTGVALGYYGGEPNALPNDLKKKEKNIERERKLQNEFAFNGDYVNRAELDEGSA